MTSRLIVQRKLVEDPFIKLGVSDPAPSRAQVLVPLERWLSSKEELLAEAREVGVILPSDKLPKDVPDLHSLAVIAIEFPRFSDGRGYSVARLLREREGYRGQLRATGWVLRDNLLYMERVGFDAFELKEGKPLESALEAFSELPVAYQATSADPRPLYRRR